MKTLRRFALGTLALLALAAIAYPVVAQNFTSITVADGSPSTPSITFLSDTDTGFYRTGSGSIGITSNGAFVGTISSTGGYNGPVRRAAIVTSSAGPTTLSAADCGKAIVSTRTSTTAEFVMPAAATAGAGCVFTFVTTSAASEVLLTPATGDNYQLKATVDAGASVVTAASTGAKNTAATNVVGDSLTVVSDGVLTWIMIGQSGIWASR